MLFVPDPFISAILLFVKKFPDSDKRMEKQVPDLEKMQGKKLHSVLTLGQRQMILYTANNKGSLISHQGIVNKIHLTKR
jgi:hypothetical protein